MIGVIVDECMGILLSLNAEKGAIGREVVTAWARTEFLQKVETPGVVAVRVKVVRREGRKIWMEAVVERESGRMLCKGEALWVEAKPAQAKL